MRAFRAIIAALLVGIGISAAGWAFAQEGGARDSVKSDKALFSEKPGETTKALNWETGEGKSYLIPA